MSTRFLGIIIVIFLGGAEALARPYTYPGIRYENAESMGLGGIVLPLADEVGNSLFNNPAGLARNEKFRAEYLNVNLEANDHFLIGTGLSSSKMFNLNGLATDLNQNTGKIYGSGGGNLTALSFGGLGVGVLYQDRTRAISDGTTISYETNQQFVPAVGYGLSLARGLLKLGYSAQWVSESVGTGSSSATGAGSFYTGLKKGRGLSQNISANITLPYTYMPTLSIMGRNLGGLHYSFGGTLMSATGATQAPADEKMSFDAAVNFMVRVSAEFKTYWYFQYLDATMATSMAATDRLSVGIDVALSSHFDFRFGTQGTNPAAGLSYKSEASEIALAWHTEAAPFTGGLTATSDTMYTLQYKLFFQDKNTRNREKQK